MDQQFARITVTGHVQGVGFRAFVNRLAHEYGVLGAVWNERDGSVRIIAGADQETLENFQSALKTGPGRVDAVASDLVEPRDFAKFEILTADPGW